MTSTNTLTVVANTAPRVLLIHNPTAGWRRRRRLRAVLDELERRGCMVTVRETTCRGDAQRFANAARAEDFDRVAVAGGDGTINEAINGLADRRLRLCVVPMGTANVLAAEIELVVHPKHIATTILDGPAARITLGRIRSGDGRVRRFSMMAGIGFDAHVVARVSLALKRLSGKFAYVVASLAQLVDHRSPVYDVTLDGVTYRAASAIVSRGRFYGGRFVIAPEARLAEPWLHVCLFHGRSRLDVVRYSLALLLGRLHRLPDVTLKRAQRVEVHGPAGETVQVDGDLDGALPVVIDLEPERLLLAGAVLVVPPPYRGTVWARAAS